jgi:hypothetical protein
LDLGGQVLLEEAGVQMHEVVEHRAAQIALTRSPTHETVKPRVVLSVGITSSANTPSECSGFRAPLVKPASVTIRTLPDRQRDRRGDDERSDAPATYHRYGARYFIAAVGSEFAAD